jgi:uroporphyrinogen III methyltransferase/synthase
MVEQQGCVYLVGSGVGSVDYLTVRGLLLLTQADVLVYDALVDNELLAWTTDRCLKLNVGKRGGQDSVSQAEINHLLVTHCQQGRRVVRLKSGDPFIFGRCTAEIAALKQADCWFEVVPGISSALAAPLLADIPLTDPVMSRCFAVLSAHDLAAIDWQTLAQIETLVILMGAKHLAEIVDRLQQRGRSPHTPIAIIRWAGHAQQQIWTGTLATIAQQTERQSIAPCVIVIGEVVNLHTCLQPNPIQNKGQQEVIAMQNWVREMQRAASLSSIQRFSSVLSSHPDLPLSGKTILMTRSVGQSSQFTELLQQQGATVIETPALEIVPPSSWEALDQAIEQLSTFDWLILTSTNGVDAFFERLAAQGKDARALAEIKIAVVGQKTATSLQQRGLQPDFIPTDFVADALVDQFPDRDHLPGMHLLFPRVETGGRELLVQAFSAQGAIVTEVAAYESACARSIAPAALQALQQNQVDIITFASSKTVQCFYQLLERSELKPDLSVAHAFLPLAAQIQIAAIGPQTAAACQRWFGRVDIEAREYTLEGLTQAIVAWVSANDRSC